MALSPTLPLALAAAASDAPTAPAGQLIAAALIGIAIIVVLITWAKLHPFLALTIGALLTGAIAGMGIAPSVTSFTGGFGSTMAGVGILVALGAIYGKLLADSGGADRIVDTLVARAGARSLPWMMGLIGAIIGLPMFFEVGLVLLVPVIILVARRSGQPLMKIAIPTLAGLSAMHALVPPHPGPLAAISTLGANLGLTLAFGVIVAIPAIIVSGPLFGRLAARWVDVPVPDLFIADETDGEMRRPSFGATLASILLPVVLMLAKAIADIAAPGSDALWKTVVDFLGMPVIALLITVIVGFFVLGRGAGFDRTRITGIVGESLGPIAGILLIVGAGGGFKQVLVDTGIGKVIADLVAGSSVSVLILAWLVAVVIRVATGSATVATITAAGILQPLTETLDSPMVALLVLAIGSGSVFLSHVNDAGFWLIKEYFRLSIPQTLKTWSVLECLISVTGLAGVLLLSIFV
ncbi:GntP family permease [Microbacterium dextranolyticum]|uniref:Gluconate:H+ symporter, GntP family protein n=1 Tax=Microbacterium dextranolyticum TaxID=36806 RepID=A0A9W6HLK4_9MICO|nr:gluconate:H+ symporter [Microbacterium dextranolyticum]MBM7463387.1 GntP family gluconate:H+ symporter [Microbacterium dextranolyticum]GLJ95510.1 gluconate:H+ symporter, GntP family protein [Microbacterium dextranolyticum]